MEIGASRTCDRSAGSRERSARSPGRGRGLRGGAAVLVFLVACGGDRRQPGYTVMDSASVAIVENVAPAWTGDAGWRIGADPILELGGDSSAVVFERIAGVVLLTDGGVIAADEGAGEITAFDSDGTLRWRFGGIGDGPAEFRLISSLGTGPADSIWVFDFGSRRFTVLDPAGTLARTLDISGSVSAPYAVGWLNDGAFVVRELWGIRSRAAPARTGMVRDPAAVVRISPDNAAVDTIGLYPGREIVITAEGGRQVMSTPLFSRNTVAVAGNRRVVIGDQAAFAIDVFEPDGARVRSVRISNLDLSIDRDAVARGIERVLEQIPAVERPDRRMFLESLPLPASRPAFDRIVLAGTGEVWVSEPAYGPVDTVTWEVFDEQGRWLGPVESPVRFRLEAVTTDAVAGVWRDELDVQSVRIYPLIRSGQH